ncbi:MAG: DUF3488 and transglutaminase-like domain-containing protein [Pyrinomonadaceae bacterium]
MTFEQFFRLISYSTVFCGFLALWVSGNFGVVGTVLFVGVIVGAWFLEGSRWQISERVGTALIVLALPTFYLAYRFQYMSFSGADNVLPGMLARMILALTAVKLLQRKSDRDWIFLYLMSFFEVLLAAGLSISALYLGSLILYLLVTVCAVVAFEIRKTAYAVEKSISADKVAERDTTSEAAAVLPIRRLPTTAMALIALIVALAMPLFFLLPRVGGAGFGGNQGGLKTSTGFSDTVRLGGIGKIQENNEVVMRVGLEPTAISTNDLYFRGVALDTFDNLSWSKSKVGPPSTFIRGPGDVFTIDKPDARDDLVVQTYYLEPLDTNVLFALPRAVGVKSGFPLVAKDPYGALKYRQSPERVTYSVFSDLSHPSVEELRADSQPYSVELANYRELPTRYDQRIADLALTITSKADNRYDKALAIEGYLRTTFAYTLEQKAGGSEPLADFLFNVREGHCEYFATAMAVMLRTQGVATRIVNGFHGGEYNDAAGMTIVRQKNAHAWVEVYFPGEDAWISFDPTPAGDGGTSASAGILGSVNKYLEALETFWIQYFVAYDNQEQRSMARTVRGSFLDYQAGIAGFLGQTRDAVAEWLSKVRGDKGAQASRAAVGYAIAYIAVSCVMIVFLIWLVRRIRRSRIWTSLRERLSRTPRPSVVEFYERMQRILTEKGLTREPFQTPLEFASALGMPEAVTITEKYNRVRFGQAELTQDEAVEVNSWLEKIKTAATQ